MGAVAAFLSSLLLFCLVFGMSATVELKQVLRQLSNRTALLIGLALQFIILPFCGFLVVKLLRLPPAMGITLLVVTSSPGGSYSNWWCSMFNAELALSVTMTAISTLLSTFMLPTNLVIYTRWTYSSDVVQALDWGALFTELVVVIGGISGGILSGAIAKRRWGPLGAQKFRKRANQLGNIAGISLVTVSITLSSGGHEASLANQGAQFFIGVALPAVIGLGIAAYLATKFDLEKPERVAVSVEACYQNTGIATAVALNMFSGNSTDLATAVSVPLYYGIVEASMLACFCLICWKFGWTKAPPDENICVVIYNSYEVEEQGLDEQEVAIEVVMGEDVFDNKPPNDLIFQQTDQGTYVVDARSSSGVFRNGMRRDQLRAQSSPLPQDELAIPNTEPNDLERPEAGNTGLYSKTMAMMKARSEGYRKPPSTPRENGKDYDPRILSAVDETDNSRNHSGADGEPGMEEIAMDGTLPAEGKSLD